MSKFPQIPTDIQTKKEWIDFVYNHPVVQRNDIPYFHLDIRPAYVNPETRTIDDDESLNTHLEVWVGGGPAFDASKEEHFPEPKGGWSDLNKWMTSHDTRLDTGGDTIEEALLNFAARLKYYYSDEGIDLNPEED